MKPLPNLMDSLHSVATRDHAKAAMKKFNAFTESHYESVNSFADIKAVDVTRELVGQFATFLYDDPAIGYSASATYLSSVKRQLEDKTKTDFFERNKNWYTRLRQHLRNKYVTAANAEGKSLQDKAPPMSMEDLRLIGRMLFLRNNQHSVSVFPSALIWEIDPLHSLAAQLAGDPFNFNTRVFSQLSGENGNTAAYINRLLVSLSGGNGASGLTKNLRSHSSRRGSAVQASSHTDINLSDLAHRGRWTMDGFNTLLEYISETNIADQKVGRVLGGWEQPKYMVNAPKLENSTYTSQLQKRFAATLFVHTENRLKKDSFVEALAACLLLYFPETHTIMPRHIVHEQMVQAVRDVLPSMSSEDAVALLKEWGASCRKRFVMANISSLPGEQILRNVSEGDRDRCFVGAHTFGAAIERLAFGLQSVGEEISDVKSRVADVACQQQQLQKQQQHILDLLLKLTPSSLNSASPPKRNSAKTSWPANLQSLANISFASLFYRYLHESLDSVPFNRKNHAQRDAVKAMKIGRFFLSGTPPPPFASLANDNERAKWRGDVQRLAEDIQTRVLCFLSSPKEEASGEKTRSYWFRIRNCSRMVKKETKPIDRCAFL